jgi:hypothetical protein
MWSLGRGIIELGRKREREEKKRGLDGKTVACLVVGGEGKQGGGVYEKTKLI